MHLRRLWPLNAIVSLKEFSLCYKALYKKIHLYPVLITSIYNLLEKCKQMKYGLKTAPVGAKKVVITGNTDNFGVVFFHISLEKYIFNQNIEKYHAKLVHIP